MARTVPSIVKETDILTIIPKTIPMTHKETKAPSNILENIPFTIEATNKQENITMTNASVEIHSTNIVEVIENDIEIGRYREKRKNIFILNK